MPSPKHYCHDCALRLGLFTPYDTSTLNLTGNAYQFGKFMKHTLPTGYAGVLSVFNRPDYAPYLDYTVTSLLSGCAEIDSQGRTNMIWYAGKNTGLTFNNGKFYCADDAIKVVLHNDVTLIHSFPANYGLHYVSRCLNCDRYIPA